MRDFMIDIETTALSVDAGIVAVACVPFTIGQAPDEGTGLHGFYAQVSLQSNISWSRSIDADTLRFWFNQPREIVTEILMNEGLTLEAALTKLSHFLNMRRQDEIRVWSNGPAFDVAILEHAYRSQSIPIPWSYKEVRDVRTILDLAGVNSKDEKYDFGQRKHHPLCDCISQIAMVSDAYNLLKG